MGPLGSTGSGSSTPPVPHSSHSDTPTAEYVVAVVPRSAANVARTRVVVTASNVVVLVSSRAVPYPLGFGTSTNAPSSKYWSVHDAGTRTLSPFASVPSDQNRTTERSTVTGAGHEYSSHCDAGRSPLHVAHVASCAPPVLTPAPSFTASTLFQDAV